MTQIEKVRQQARDCVKKISQAVNAAPWDDLDFYSNYIAQTYFYVCNITRAIAFAASRCSLEEEALHVKLIEGLNEEKGHQLLALSDVRALGFDISQFAELTETSAYYQTLFYKIQKEGPFALFGYALPLEGLAATAFERPAATVYKTYGEKASNFIKAHCTLDVEHFEEGLQFLDKFTPAQLQTVERNLPFSSDIYIKMVEQVRARCGAQKLRKAG
ncbi:MAG: iron-containing redox enzyme family protein [Oligoflexia bacterium]|nr:iron-containing redox enzyme family protein [Oligoflexia bacterium]